MTILHLETLSGVARGLTRTSDVLLAYEDNPEAQFESEQIERARQDLRMITMREGIFAAIRSVVDLWSTDASISQVRMHRLISPFVSLTIVFRLSASSSDPSLVSRRTPR